MKLRNKKTGEIVDLLEIARIDDVSNEFYIRLSDNEGRCFKAGFNSLAELNEEWEDYEEPKEYWYISDFGFIFKSEINDGTVKSTIEEMKSIGNYFESKEEAEKAVEKLKAWKRLKDKGFRFLGYHHRLCETKSEGEIGFEIDDYKATKEDLDLLFGGENA